MIAQIPARNERLFVASATLEFRKIAPGLIRRYDIAFNLLFASLVAQAMIVSGANEAGEKRVWRQRL
jgi:hypothetical protein